MQALKKFFLNQQLYPLWVLLFLVLLLRVLTAQMVTTGGLDDLDTWITAKNILYGNSFELFHRSIRFGAIIPVMLTQLVFGTSAWVYYVAPAIVSLLTATFMYFLGLSIKGRTFAFFSTLLLMVFPELLVDGSNPRISGFSVLYVVLSLYFLMQFLKQKPSANQKFFQHYKYLIALSFSMFLIYFTKVTELYFLPGFLLAIWWKEKKLKHVIVFAGFLFGLYCLETLFYALFTNYPLGQLQIILGSHMQSETLIPLASFWHLFKRYTTGMEFYWTLSLLIYFSTSLFILIKKWQDLKIRSVIIISYFFMFFMTFAVKSLNPVIPINTFRTRYLSVMVPFIMFLLVYFIHEGLSWYSQKKNKKIALFFNNKTYFLIGLILVGLTFLGYSKIYLNQFYKKEKVGYFQVHPYKLVPYYQKLLQNSYDNEVPIIIKGVSYKNNHYTPIVQKVTPFLKQGLSKEEACKKANVPLQAYEYAFKATTSINYIPERIFNIIFFNEKQAWHKEKGFVFPEKQVFMVNNQPLGFILKKPLSLEKIQEFQKQNTEVILMGIKPFSAKKIKFSEIFD